MKKRWVIVGVLFCLFHIGFYGSPRVAAAGESEKAWISKVISIQGSVLAKRVGAAGWQPLRLDDTLFAGDRIRVEANSRAGILLSNDAVLRLDQNTTLVFTGGERKTTFILRLLKGAANFFSHRPRSLKIVTPFVNGVVEGTEFYVQVDDAQTRIELYEGRILAQNPHGDVRLTKSQQVTASADSAPQRQVLVRPRDSVQWALYYPPVLAFGPGEGPPALRPSFELADQGRLSEAIDRLEQTAPPSRDARFLVYRAALLLNVGRVTEARTDIREVLTLEPQNGDALALQAVIAMVQNRKTDALQSAREAVSAAPRSTAAHIALSYALQAEFKLQEALQAAQQAVEQDPENATARARLAELRLSVGELDQGIQAAQKAAELAPHSAHAHTILGFAYLTQIKTDRARQAFNQAIAMDSAAPLPRLGLGLAQIRDGNLEKGRSQIEIAVGLDPANALMRSYLGKAYFDEKRGPLDEQQLDIAKTLDPNDPTPWFYDAICKQTLNRPVEALQDLQKSIELNDNRAVYRSRLMLDDDLAARSASLGRVYRDLSFQEQALRESSKSLCSVPADFSVHRLLSDIYADRPRHEIARVSELLQSQLMQPLSFDPVHPQLSESTLITSGNEGPQSLSLGEYNTLFAGNRTMLQLGGAVGNNSTWSDEISVNGLHKRFSYSIGQFHYETEGFRENNNLEKDIADAFAQFALSPYASIQVEYRQRDIEHGDLELRFDPENYSHTKQVSRKEKIPRLGFHYAPNIQHNFIASLIFNQTEYSLYEEQDGGPGPFGPIVGIEDRYEEDDAYNMESQYIFQGDRMNIIVGAGYYEQRIEETVSTIVRSGTVILGGSPNQEQDLEITHANAYTYAHFKLHSSFDLTVGLSGDTFKKEEIEANQLNPKLGFNWYPTSALTFRAAAFRGFKRSLVTNQTVEPVQLSGFTQFFDDYLATDAKRYGVGLDYQINTDLTCGLEMTFNDMSHPIIDSDTGAVEDEEHDEYHHRFYLYWLANSYTVVSAEYMFDHYKRKPEEAETTRPYELQTHSLPLTFSYFHPSGLFLKLKGTYYNQRVEHLLSLSQPTETNRDDFTLIDINIGYRLPKRYGVVTLSVNNLFDTGFNFHDTNFLTASEQDPIIKPERQFYLMAKFKI